MAGVDLVSTEGAQTNPEITWGAIGVISKRGNWKVHFTTYFMIDDVFFLQEKREGGRLVHCVLVKHLHEWLNGDKWRKKDSQRRRQNR